MTRPSTYTQTRYLEAKRTVDDRALHRPTIDSLRRALTGDSGPIRIVEAGCGTGSMLRRLLAWDVLPDTVVYHGFDLDPAVVDSATTELLTWGEAAGYTVDRVTATEEFETTAGEVGGATIALSANDGTTVRATFAVGDAVERGRQLDGVARAINRDRGVVDGRTDLLARRRVVDLGCLKSGGEFSDAERDHLGLRRIVLGRPRCH